MSMQFTPSKSSETARIAVSTVALDPVSYRALSNFISGVPGAVMVTSLDTYSGAEWEIGRAGAHARVRVCFLDYDQNPEQAIWITERLRTDYPEVGVFAVSNSSEADRI